jgi:hypothetical protein
LYEVQKLLYQINVNSHVRARFRTDPDGLLADYRISEEEARALKALDVSALYQLGVHPLLLASVAGAVGISRAQYRTALETLRNHFRGKG